MDIENHLISVIIPVYNVELYLDDCLQSVIKQTFSNLEILIVDDGSTDSSGEICDKYEKSDARIRVFHQVNQGLSAARNRGLSQANGQYVVFVDSDDLLPIGAIENMLQGIEKTGADILQGDFTGEEEFFGEYQEREYDLDLYSGKDFVRKDILSTSAWAKMYKKELWDKWNFREGIIHEDYELMYKLFYDVSTVAHLHQVVYLVREREGSITRKRLSEKNMILLEIDEQKIEFFKERKDSILLQHAYSDYYNHLLLLYKVGHKREIREKYRKNIRNFVAIDNLNLKTKCKLVLCCFNPSIW